MTTSNDETEAYPTQEEIMGVVLAGTRGEVFAEFAKIAAPMMLAVTEAFNRLDQALDTANTANKGKENLSLSTEDKAVIAASKVYLKAETDFLLGVQAYLEAVAPVKIPASALLPFSDSLN